MYFSITGYNIKNEIIHECFYYINVAESDIYNEIVAVVNTLKKYIMDEH